MSLHIHPNPQNEPNVNYGLGDSDSNIPCAGSSIVTNVPPVSGVDGREAMPVGAEYGNL